MTQQSTGQPGAISATRLRIGLLFIFGWWLQLPALILLLAPVFGYSDSDKGVIALATAVMIIQSIFALIGIMLAGKEIITIIHETKNREVPKTIWRIFVHGSTAQTPPKQHIKR